MPVKVLGVEGVLRGLGLKEEMIEIAVQQGTNQVAAKIVAEAKRNFTSGRHIQGRTASGRVKWTPSGHIGNSGEGPNKRSGNLWNSIIFEQVTGLAGYRSDVIVGADYARFVEEGTGRWRNGVKYPYMEPAVKRVEPLANRIFTVAILKAIR